jgi:predicted outer membrane repeat protein
MNSIRMRKLLVPALVPLLSAILLALVFFVCIPPQPATGGGLDQAPVLGCPSEPPQPGPQLIVNTAVMTTCDGICGPDHCTLREAIHLANTLPGSNTIELANSVTYVLTAADNNLNGYPLITSTISLHGNGSTLTRSPSAPPFRLLKISAGAAVTLTQLTLSYGKLDYSSAQAQGAGIYNEGALSVSKTSFTHNACDANLTYGGAIYNYLGVVTIARSTFYSNTATSFGSSGGAIYSIGGRLEILNSTFTDNLAGGLYYDTGGAIYSSSLFTITHSTFSGNRSLNDGGTIYVSGGSSLLLRNSIISGGAGATACHGTVLDGGGNLSWPDASCPGLNQDPLLRPLAMNGGSTATMALRAASPAIHHAVLADCPLIDQRGWPRWLQNQCDSGAYEWSWLLFHPVIGKP